MPPKAPEEVELVYGPCCGMEHAVPKKPKNGEVIELTRHCPVRVSAVYSFDANRGKFYFKQWNYDGKKSTGKQQQCQ